MTSLSSIMDGNRYANLSLRRYRRLKSRWRVKNDNDLTDNHYIDHQSSFLLTVVRRLQGWAFVHEFRQSSAETMVHHDDAIRSLSRRRWMKFSQHQPGRLEWHPAPATGSAHRILGTISRDSIERYGMPIEWIRSAAIVSENDDEKGDRLQLTLIHGASVVLELGSTVQMNELWWPNLQHWTWLHGSLGTWEKQLGRGGFATVSLHRCRQPSEGMDLVVVKKFDGQTLQALQDLGENDRYREELEQIERECRLTCAVSGHPNLVRGYGYELSPVPRLALEWCSEGDLHVIICAQWNVPLAVKFAVALDVLRALHFLHQNGVVHRDVKSSNIFLTSALSSFSLSSDLAFPFAPVAKLGDFGLSLRVTEASSDRRNRHTPEYASLQMLDSPIERADPRDDLFSFGTVWWELVEWRTVERWEKPDQYRHSRERLIARQPPHLFVSCTLPWLQEISYRGWEAPWIDNDKDPPTARALLRTVYEEMRFCRWLGQHHKQQRTDPVSVTSSSSSSSSSVCPPSSSDEATVCK